ncbi:MAG: sulfite exporter TauE/SafE family protein [Desulfopila sp.]|jgi:uncharacterized membrane protein YfcA|nr:sulfite exporter TauE/SafE family protein [Desulfopila sp.]
MYFETAGIEVAVWVPPLIGLVVSFFSSMGGVSGAFLLLPFQVSFLGYADPSVSATNQLYNIVAIPSGVYRYWREGRMVWPLTWVVIAGTLPGVFLGAYVRIVYLPDVQNFKLFASAVLFYIGYRMAKSLITENRKGDSSSQTAEKRFRELVRKHGGAAQSDPGNTGGAGGVTITHFTLKRLGYTFYGEKFDVPFWGIFSLSLVVGVVGGIYGIGGGAIVAPFLVAFFRLPVYTVAGAALMGTFVTSIAGVYFYQALAPYYPELAIAPDWLLGFLFGIGGIAGMYLGAHCQKHISATVIKWMLAVIIAATASKYLFDFFVQ